MPPGLLCASLNSTQQCEHCFLLQCQEVGIINSEFKEKEHDVVNKTNQAAKFFHDLVAQLEQGLDDMAAQYAGVEAA